ncbi:MAG: hypothetical protein KDC73_13485 [Ignavibacteriae bacterium]|nr:hypothetical protein [Ignavibacteriota bacterium]MCB9242724.1 hypothetical protein [Ignavibacteriales bacterium]
MIKYIFLILILLSGCSESPKNEPILSNHNIPIKEGEVQLVIEPEYDNYIFGENIWLKISIHNNTDTDYYLTYLPDKLSVPLKIVSNNGNENIRLREDDERMGALDSIKVSPGSSFISFINLTENYFDQRYVTKGIYDIKGSYDKYSQIKYVYLVPGGKKINYPPPLESNSIKIEILPAGGKEEKVCSILFNNTKKFDSQIERLKYLVDEFPDSKFYPQIFSEYIYYLAAEGDSIKLFSNIDHFLDNNATYETIMVLNRVSNYLRNKLNWDYEQRRNYFLSLIEKYTHGKVAECIEFKLAYDQYYKKANERMEGWK